MPEKKLTTKKVINSLTREDWDPLLRLIPEIDCTDNFGELGGMDMNADGSVNLPYYIPADIVIQFQNIAYDLGIVIHFDWPGWEQGQIMFRDNTFDFNSVDVFTKCKLLSAIIRADRFSDGTLIYAFQSGLILKVLKSIAREVNWFPDELTEAMHSEFLID
jgi:hypothetical protein